jgi:MYXO-CTERM domain-containing protein
MRARTFSAILVAALLVAPASSANMPAPDPCGRHREGEPCDGWPGVCRASPGTSCGKGACLICVDVDAGAPGAREEVVVKPKSGCAVTSGEDGAGWGLVAAALGAACLLRRRPRRASIDGHGSTR